MSSRRCRSSAGGTALWILRAIGVVECALALWVLTGWQPVLAAPAQTALLVSMNSGGLLWARRIIPDPGGMIVKNFAFLVLAWVVARAGVPNGCNGMMRETPWEAGRFDARGGAKKILFGRMYEDAAGGGGRLYQGGVSSSRRPGVPRWRSLASPVTAVDINAIRPPLRLTPKRHAGGGGPMRVAGAADRA